MGRRLIALNVIAMEVGRVKRSIERGNKVLFAGRVQFQSQLITTHIQQVSFSTIGCKCSR